ncbi:beta-ketoacyl synthase chain length factor [Methylococcus sp. EFPC2]|uniref:beta-ketoacyl synthase chain length factor n=1 Tax=Methylococcus sp. EFPC2 TaxID=2812648 RepID=UPI001967E0BD|nr:beta-ketoacyl synthase chain length factor [Methylococcus sp. EFPC2]QSA98869.1 beta-ketoacyl synthase chain length factor [Methylococcus sp. EFPC2]
MDTLTILGYGAATSDVSLREHLPFPCADIDRNTLPANLRRRSSQATQLAFSAATLACRNAGRTPGDLPAVFAGAGGEIQITDVLCVELAKTDGVISPTAFHNAVHNTASGYWSIVHGVTAPATAMGAGHDSFAMALVESWCQLETAGGELLLVCYDERWPDYLAAPVGTLPFAAALALAAGSVPGGLATLGRPRRNTETAIPLPLGVNVGWNERERIPANRPESWDSLRSSQPTNADASWPAEWRDWCGQAPVLAAVPLLEALNTRRSSEIPLSAASGWTAALDI